MHTTRCEIAFEKLEFAVFESRACAIGKLSIKQQPRKSTRAINRKLSATASLLESADILDTVSLHNLHAVPRLQAANTHASTPPLWKRSYLCLTRGSMRCRLWKRLNWSRTTVCDAWITNR